MLITLKIIYNVIYELLLCKSISKLQKNIPICLKKFCEFWSWSMQHIKLNFSCSNVRIILLFSTKIWVKEKEGRRRAETLIAIMTLTFCLAFKKARAETASTFQIDMKYQVSISSTFYVHTFRTKKITKPKCK